MHTFYNITYLRTYAHPQRLMVDNVIRHKERQERNEDVRTDICQIRH